MGITARLSIVRPGYIPRGGGIIEVDIEPVTGKMKPIRLAERGDIVSIDGIALASHLKDRRVGERMAEKCNEVLRARGYHARIEIVNDTTALQRGAALAVFVTTTTGCIIGADRAGEPRRTSEDIGRYVARQLIEDLDSGATIDRYVADQLVLYAALADGVSEYRTPRLTEHVDTNLWLVESILGAKTEVNQNLVRIHGVGYFPLPS